MSDNALTGLASDAASDKQLRPALAHLARKSEIRRQLRPPIALPAIKPDVASTPRPAPVRYTLRIQFGLYQNSEMVREQLLKVCRVGNIDEVMFFIFAEEQNNGHESLERIAQWLDALRPWKQALEDHGFETSLNPWHTTLHADRGRTLRSDQPWQPMVDWRGNSAKAVVCPLDPLWQEYYTQAMRLYAAEKFRVVWIDDDIRYHNHAPLDWGGCWCPLHLSEFNRRASVNATREEIVANALRAGPPHPWRTIWLDMWDDLQLNLIQRWRDVVEGTGTKLGLMSSDPEVHSAEGRRWPKWWSAIGNGSTPAVHRPNFWEYGDAGSLTIVQGISFLQQNRLIQPEQVESDPEIENFPYGRWNKSFRQLTAQMSMAQIFGSTRLAISMYDFMGNQPDDDPERAIYLGGIKPMLAWLGEQFAPAMKSEGIGIPWHPDISRRLHTDGRVDWRALQQTSRGWEYWLAPSGHAFQKTPHERVNALAGGMPWAFDEQTLRHWLVNGLLLDGPAASVLVERGFGPLIGLRACRFATQNELVYSTEETLDANFGLRAGASMSVNAGSGSFSHLIQGDLARDVLPISTLKNPSRQDVGHGAFAFHNELGGRVVVVPWDASKTGTLCMARQHQLHKIIQWLGNGRSCGSVSGGPWLVPQFLRNHDTWRGVVWNASPDAVRRIEVNLPEEMGSLHCAVQINAEGERTEAKVDGNQILLRHPMHQWELLVLNPSGES